MPVPAPMGWAAAAVPSYVWIETTAGSTLARMAGTSSAAPDAWPEGWFCVGVEMALGMLEAAVVLFERSAARTTPPPTTPPTTAATSPNAMNGHRLLRCRLLRCRL